MRNICAIIFALIAYTCKYNEKRLYPGQFLSSCELRYIPQTREQVLFLAQNKSWNTIQKSDEPALNEAVRLESYAVIEAICKNDYDLALRRATHGQLSSMDFKKRNN